MSPIPDPEIPVVPGPSDFVPDTPTFNLDFVGGAQLEKILISTVIAVGVLFLFFGTRLFKITLFIFSFMGAGFFAYMFTYQLTCCDEVTGQGNSQTSLIVAGVCALLVSCLVLKAFKLAIFAIGAGVGFVIWLVFKALFPNVLPEPWMTYLVLAGAILIFGAIALKLEKFWLLLATPALGAFMLLAGIDHFVEDDLNVFQMLDVSTSGCKTEECYALYGSYFLLVALGIIIQYRYTSHWASKRRDGERREKKGERKARRKFDKERRKKRSKRHHKTRRHRRYSTDSDSDY